VNFVVVGGSAGLGRALCEEAARRGHNVLLVASDERDLAPMATSLQLRFGVRTAWLACHFGDEPAVGHAGSAVTAAARAFGPIDGVFYPIGLSRDDDDGFLEEAESLRLLRINFLSQAALTAALWPGMLEREQAYVVGFGSVAAIRGRGRNVVYTAAKRALSSYFESLRHMAAGTSIRIHFYQLGYMETPRTHAMKLFLPKASASRLARFVLDRLDRDSGPRTYPAFWIPVSLALRCMPWALYKRMRF
jgi:NAD(P)-dependent dehydrogenase (short-subunit alcohol dehydrogenase family)